MRLGLSSFWLLVLFCALFSAAALKSPQKNHLQSLHKASAKQRRGGTLIASKSDGDGSSLNTFLTGLTSGAVAGTCVDFVLFPLDTIKTRLQSQAGVVMNLALLNDIYSGLVPAMAASAPACAAFFGAYDFIRTRLAANYGIPTWVSNVAAACGGDLAHSVVRAPFEVVKQRMQAGIDSSTRTAVQTIYKSRGIAGFFAGATALAVRDLPFDMIEYPLYEYFKSSMARRLHRPLLSWESALCGFVAGGIAAALTTPLDVVKTRYLTQPLLYDSMLKCFLMILQKEGASALFSGVGPRVAMISFGGAIFFGVYEASKSFIQAKGVFDTIGTSDATKL